MVVEKIHKEEPVMDMIDAIFMVAAMFGVLMLLTLIDDMHR